jgi:hypothetical protein
VLEKSEAELQLLQQADINSITAQDYDSQLKWRKWNLRILKAILTKPLPN